MNLERPPTRPAADSDRIPPEGQLLLNNKYLVLEQHARSLSIFRKDEVHETEFAETLGEQEVATDLSKKKVRKDEFAKQDEALPEWKRLLRKASVVAEAICYQGIALHDWMSVPGVKVYIEKTSEYDDIFNQADILIVIDRGEGEEPLALSVDVTTGVQSVAEKVHGIKAKIDQGTLTTIKYHETLDGKKVRLTEVPHAILSLDVTELLKLMKTWQGREAEAVRRQLRENPIQRLFVEEVVVQLTEYQAYAAKNGKDAVAERIGEVLRTFQDIYNEKAKRFGPIANERHLETLSIVERCVRQLRIKATTER